MFPSQQARVKIGSWLLNQKSKPDLFLFYLLILFLPIQVGKHFWPQSAFVYGLRIDYLSPTFYLTDLLVLGIITIAFIKEIRNKKTVKKLASRSIKIIVAITLLLFISASFAKNQPVAFYGIIKFLEFLFLAIFIAKKIKSFKYIYLLMSIAVIYESIIAIAQFINQGSLGRIFYFLGERTFTGQTPGIANASLGGELVLRAYGTFSHPNVLAGFLVVFMSAILVNMIQRKTLSSVYWTSIVIGTIAIFLTLSRIAITLWLVTVLLALIARYKLSKKITLLLILLIFLVFLFPPLYLRFTNIVLSDQSIYNRGVLIDASIKMFKESPFIGVGPNNFIVNLSEVIKVTSVSLLQPVHNIYLLILSEIGLFGLVVFLLLLYFSLKNINKNSPCSLSFVLILILGLFDHYFLTLQQGQLLLSIILGFCWAKTPK